jgi:extracellular elastinolytic metalloproteinase
VVAQPTGNEACSSVPSTCQSSVSLDDVDVWSHDKPWDTGLEPDPATAADNMWESEDIWVRNDATAGGHQDPELGQVNYVHVHWENKGPATAYNGVVHLYYAVASSGLSWPTDWTEIGTGAIGSLASGATFEVSIPWVPIVSGHVCLLARLESAQDPMSFAEGTDVNYNTRYNNNIVWRNVNVVDLIAFDYVVGTMIVRNVALTPALTRLSFRDRLDTGVRGKFLQRGRVLIDLGPTLYNRWLAGGSVGGGIRVAGANTIEILPTTGAAPFIQFQTQAREAFETHPRFENTAANVDRSKVDKHVFEIRQTNQSANALVGGVTYQIKAPFKK